MNNELLDEEISFVSHKTEYFQKIKNFIIGGFALFCISWLILRISFNREVMEYAQSILVNDDNEGLVFLAAEMSYLFVCLLITYIIITLNISPFAITFQESLIANIIILVIASTFFWMTTLFTGVFAAGLIHIIFGLSEIPSMDVGTVVISIGFFGLLYRSFYKKCAALK